MTDIYFFHDGWPEFPESFPVTIITDEAFINLKSRCAGIYGCREIISGFQVYCLTNYLFLTFQWTFLRCTVYIAFSAQDEKRFEYSIR
ncbi:MAG TPA: hypothetical protein DEA96_13525 [Leptospiraceae bacterium]|nr:hypothetical protein [Spirochaetaceae bacterium]HBS05982.1 hypothetical protein [Leptospiraceae bacterium]